MHRSAVPTFGLVAIDCPEPAKLAEFYAALLDWPKPEVGDGHWVTITGPNGVRIAFQRVANYRAPQWPGQEVPQQVHLDFDVADLAAAHERAIGLGAKLLDDRPADFNVYADPVGHPFCLVAG